MAIDWFSTIVSNCFYRLCLSLCLPVQFHFSLFLRTEISLLVIESLVFFYVSLQAPYGPPYAMIQGTLNAEGNTYTPIPTEHCPTISRGSVAWVGSGPEFFISLANHHEWKQSYTVFGSVLPEDMEIAERIAGLPTIPDVWSSVNVSVLEKPVSLTIRRMKTNQEQEETGS